MKFNTTGLIGLALALAASASPVAVYDTELSHDLETRDTNLVCLGRGPGVNRADIIWRIDAYCDARQGWIVKDGYDFIEHSTFDGHPAHIGVLGKGGCEWSIGQECHSNLRILVDQCNVDGENGKQGGIYSDDCATYYMHFVDA